MPAIASYNEVLDVVTDRVGLAGWSRELDYWILESKRERARHQLERALSRANERGAAATVVNDYDDNALVVKLAAQPRGFYLFEMVEMPSTG